METRSKHSKSSVGNERTPFQSTPNPPSKSVTLETLENEALDEYNEDEDESVSSLDSDSDLGTDYDSVNTYDMSPEEMAETPAEQRDEEIEREPSPEGSKEPFAQPARRGLVDYFAAKRNGRRLTRSMVEKKEKEKVLTGYEEEPFKKVDPAEFYAAMDAVEPDDEAADDDSVMDDSDETSESGTDYDSVNTYDMSPEEMVETPAEQREKETEREPSPEGSSSNELEREMRGLVDYFAAKVNGRRLTRSMVEKEKKGVVLTGYEEEPFRKVDAVEFYAAMDAVEPYNEDEDEDFEMDDSDETSESGTDKTEDLSDEEMQ